MKKILLAAGIIGLLVCCKKEEPSYYVDELVIDTENCVAEGSYVLGSELNEYCQVTIPYENGHGGTAVVSAPESNGMKIDPVTVEIASGNGSVTAVITGRPLSVDNSYLQINIEYDGETYLSSVEIPVIEDMDPSGTIDFQIDDSPVVNFTGQKVLEFTVTPTMSAIVTSGAATDNVSVSIESDPATGKGTVTLTPADAFLSGELEITATFGAREPQTKTISLNAFAGGDGTEENPYQINDTPGFNKIRYGLDKAFSVENELTVDAGWIPVGDAESPFTGTIQAGNHAVTMNIGSPDMDYAALFSHIGENAVIDGLVLKGSVTGKDYVAALAAYSDAEISADVSEVKISGSNHIAACIASGKAKDDTVIEFGENVVSAVNIIMGESEATGKLGLASAGPDIEFNPGDTGSSWQYDKESDTYTVTKGAEHQDGTVTFIAKIGNNVTSGEHAISLTSKRMFASGTGVEGDPYVVEDADQFAATLSTYSSAWVRLDSDITVANWTSIEEFSGNLDGGGHIVSGLDKPFASTLTGTVNNIRFKDVNITAGTGACGTIANLLGGKVFNTAVTGTLSAPSAASSGDTGFGGIAGQAQGSAVIDNCYVNVTMTTNSNFATGGLVGVIKGTDGVTMSNSTVEGTISGSISGTKLGGILGRKTNTNQNSKDIIKGCLVTAGISMSGTGSNMIGGVFGALQGSTVSGDYVGGLTIEQTAFTGSVSGGNSIGGIGGVCCSVRDCYVSGSVQATSVTSSSTAAAAGISAAAKGDVTRCVVYGARITGQPKGSSYTAGIINVKNGNNPVTSKCAVIDTQIEAGGFAIYGSASSDITCSDNYRWQITYANNGADYTPIAGTDTYGQDGTEAEPTQELFEGLGYDFTSVWTWNSTTGAPELQNAGCDDSIKL